MKQGTKTRKVIDDIFSDAGFKPNIVLEIGSINTIQKTAVKGSALAFIPEKAINFSEVGDNLVFFSINPKKYYWPIVITYRKGSYPTRATKDFISMLKSYLDSIPSN
jgi:DNA-binding transcriptional LysR family regulator